MEFITPNDARVKKLEEENKELLGRLSDQKKILEDNKALRDQFESSGPPSKDLISAKIIGAPGFIPGVTTPDFFILDKGMKDSVEVGRAVIYKDILVGEIVSANEHFSKAILVSNPSFLVTVESEKTKYQGVVKGDGGRKMILDNVAQSEEIGESDILITKGDASDDGKGIPPGLVVGKIESIDKKPSDVFQKGEVLSPLNFTNLNTVFVVIN